MANIEIESLFKGDRGDQFNTRSNPLLASSAIHKLATGKDLTYTAPANHLEEGDGPDPYIGGASLPRKVNEIKFSQQHYQRTESDNYLVNDGNGANGRSQFMQSPGIPGFKARQFKFSKQSLPDISIGRAGVMK